MALRSAREIWERCGPFSDEAFDKVQKPGYGDAEILEIIAKVVETTFMNYTNDSLQTEVELSLVEARGSS